MAKRRSTTPRKTREKDGDFIQCASCSQSKRVCAIPEEARPATCAKAYLYGCCQTCRKRNGGCKWECFNYKKKLSVFNG